MVFSSLIFLYGFFSLSLLGYGLLGENLKLLSEISVEGAWLGVAAYTLHIYLDFSAYSDMAIGMGRMIGLHYLENFNYPYISRSVTEYLAQLNCSRQDEMLAYLHDNMSDNVLKVDTVSRLVEHNDEYIYYRTDHHWTALGAYYADTALCDAAGNGVPGMCPVTMA